MEWIVSYWSAAKQFKSQGQYEQFKQRKKREENASIQCCDLNNPNICCKIKSTTAFSFNNFGVIQSLDHKNFCLAEKAKIICQIDIEQALVIENSRELYKMYA